MNKLTFTVVTTTAMLSAASLMAQQRRISPHETVSASIDGNRITIVYGRPYTKDPNTGENRKIWGGLVPYGSVWRTGADEATLFITQQPISIGGATVPAGAYTLWTLPSENGPTKLMINRQIGQWGAARGDLKQIYDESRDVAQVILKKDALDKPVDQFTITIEKNPTGGGTLRMKWATTQFSVPFTVR